MKIVQPYGSAIPRLMRKAILDKVAWMLGALATASTSTVTTTSADAVAHEMQEHIADIFGRNVIISQVDVSAGVCTAHVRFNGAPNSSGGDREVVRVLWKGGTWVHDPSPSMAHSSLRNIPDHTG